MNRMRQFPARKEKVAVLVRNTNPAYLQLVPSSRKESLGDYYFVSQP